LTLEGGEFYGIPNRNYTVTNIPINKFIKLKQQQQQQQQHQSGGALLGPDAGLLFPVGKVRRVVN